jgi:hypothetical protein
LGRATRVEDKLRYALEGAYYVLAFILALRGEEIPLIELCGIHHHLRMGMGHAKSHVKISLLGRLKNEIGASYHLMPVLATTWRSRAREVDSTSIGRVCKTKCLFRVYFLEP